MTKIACVVLGICALALGNGYAAAQSVPQQIRPTTPVVAQELPSTELEDVVVEGRRLRQAVDQFVDEIIAAPARRGPARWHRNVCVGVVGMRREAAQIVADRVSDIAFRVGLNPGEPGCSPNILIMASNDGQALARSLVEARPRAFRPAYAGAARDGVALEQFQNTTAVVRWWHVGVPIHRDTGQIAVKLPGYSPPLLNQAGSGLLRTNVRNDLRRAFVIVDMRQTLGLSFQQLGDYIGMVALAQIDPETDTASYDTVLNLFDDERYVTGITDWDLSYLTSLYDAELNRVHAIQQRGQVASIMYRDRRADRDNTPEH